MKLVLFIALFMNPMTLLATEFMSVGHRGAAGYAPENTMASFKKAIELGATHLELDIHQSKDGHLIVMHDGSVDRTTDGSGEIKDLTLSQIKALDAGSWFSEKYKRESVPTLDEVFELLLKNSEIKAIVELKNGSDLYSGIEAKLVQLVKKFGLNERVIYKSFRTSILEALRSLDPSVPELYVFLAHFRFLGVTFNPYPNFDKPMAAKVEILQPHVKFVSDSFVRRAHWFGYKVVVWGVESQRQMRSMLKLGVDGIETDDLATLNGTLRAFSFHQN